MTATTPPPLLNKPEENPVIELKSAAQLYWLFAFVVGLPFIIVIALSGKPDTIARVVVFSCVGVFLTLLILAGILLFKKKKAGLYLGWALMPLILLSAPIGTAFGVFIITKIVKPNVRALLK